MLNAVCKHAELRGLVVQQGGSKALIPLALEGTDKGTRCAASALSRIGITQDPAIAFPRQRSCDVIRPISLLLDPECRPWLFAVTRSRSSSKALVFLLVWDVVVRKYFKQICFVQLL